MKKVEAKTLGKNFEIGLNIFENFLKSEKNAKIQILERNMPKYNTSMLSFYQTFLICKSSFNVFTVSCVKEKFDYA